MPAVTPSFVFDLESRMRHIQVNDMARLMASENQWWDVCTKRITTGARKDVVTWCLETATMESIGKYGGNLNFDDLTMLEYDYEVNGAGKGLRLRRQQFEDLDGNGVNLALSWTRQMTAQASYWPQKQVTTLLKNGHLTTVKSYDNVAFFSASHPLNPLDTGVGTYSNLFTSVPIDVSVTPDVALKNLSTVFAKIAGIKLANGTDPRFLRPAAIIAGPTLFPRAVQLTNAKFLAQAAATGGGGADVEALISALGYGMPTMASELDGFESDTTYFVVAKQESTDELGAFLYVDREPFSIRYYTGRGGGNGVDAILDRADQLEWHSSGRNVAIPGHPYLIFKCTA
jgi:hypothetical protein